MHSLLRLKTNFPLMLSRDSCCFFAIWLALNYIFPEKIKHPSMILCCKFLEKLKLYAKLGQKWFCWNFKVLSLSHLTINQNFSSIPQIYTTNTTILIKENFANISQVSRQTYIVWKIGEKWSSWDFEVLPPSHAIITQKFSPIPQIYTPNTTIMTKRNFWKNQGFQKNLHCVQNWYIKCFPGILKCYPLIMRQSIEITVLFHRSTHQTLPFW